MPREEEPRINVMTKRNIAIREDKGKKPEAKGWV